MKTLKAVFSVILTKIEGEAVKKEPSGKDLLKTLIDLLAEQEGVKITYEITPKSC